MEGLDSIVSAGFGMIHAATQHGFDILDYNIDSMGIEKYIWKNVILKLMSQYTTVHFFTSFSLDVGPVWLVGKFD